MQQDGNTIRSKVFSSFMAEMAHSNGGPHSSLLVLTASLSRVCGGTETMKNESHNNVGHIE